VKRILLCAILLTTSIQITTIEKLKPHPKPKPEITLFKAYVFFKEMFYINFILDWWLDNQKADRASVYCQSCDFEMNSLYIYGCFAAMGDTKKIAKLKQLLYSGADDTLMLFLLKISLQEEFECPQCLDYCGWYIKTPESLAE